MLLQLNKCNTDSSNTKEIKAAIKSHSSFFCIFWSIGFNATNCQHQKRSALISLKYPGLPIAVVSNLYLLGKKSYDVTLIIIKRK